MTTTELEVSVELTGRTVPVGIARIGRRRGDITTDFTYDVDYLTTRGAYPIDPGLPFDARQVVMAGFPGAFSDAAPDRWGRRLITRRIRAEERPETPGGGAQRDIWDLDYLLGVSDRTRQGALRFRLRGAAQFAHPSLDVPRMVRLPELLNAADRVTADGGDDDFAAVKVLLDAGTGTLGGARPKASVVGDGDGLWIAKFPHHTDEWDVMAWEKTALDLAERAGIETPGRRITRVDGRTVLLLERFDRSHGERIAYLSAMTLLGEHDGAHRDYGDIAAELADVSAAADDDLAALWRRVAFNVAVHNTDDHLRNHGVLRDGSGWRLSPVFDVNPNPETSEGRQTSIGGAVDRSDELDGLMELAGAFGLDDARAGRILGDVFAATEKWREVASGNGVRKAEITRFERAFEGLRSEIGPVRDARRTSIGRSDLVRVLAEHQADPSLRADLASLGAEKTDERDPM